jgi:hypothetical protein
VAIPLLSVSVSGYLAARRTGKAYCIYPGSTVRVHGSIIHLGEVVGLLRSCETLYETLQGRAGLDCIEPVLRVELVAEPAGHIKVDITITPNHLTEAHNFTDRFDQTYLPPIISSCMRILEKHWVTEDDKLPA